MVMKWALKSFTPGIYDECDCMLINLQLFSSWLKCTRYWWTTVMTTSPCHFWTINMFSLLRCLFKYFTISNRIIPLHLLILESTFCNFCSYIFSEMCYSFPWMVFSICKKDSSKRKLLFLSPFFVTWLCLSSNTWGALPSPCAVCH
jgi:hypothetical protein